MILIRHHIISPVTTPVGVQIPSPTIQLGFPSPPPPSFTTEGEVTGWFDSPESLPRFPGCEHAGVSQEARNECARIKLIEYIRDNLSYPQIAKDYGIQGRAAVQFVVEADGTISNIQCIRRLGYGIDAEAVRIIDAMNDLPDRWTPGKRYGRLVKSKVTLPMLFKL